jgi:hypothetical protein
VEDSSAEGTTFVVVLPQAGVTKEKTTREEASEGRLQLQHP